jgi:L-alanine-DL-glutamate epimerase-like enolase superfamily enzyme
MELRLEPVSLNLRTTFRVAHGASDQRHNVVVRLTQDGLTGSGEAAAVFYYGDTQESLMAYLRTLPDLGRDPFALETILARLPAGPQAAKAAVDMALHDLCGQMLGQPLYRLFGLAPEPLPETSFTIGIDEPELMAERARQSGYPIIKIKVGTQHDEAVVSAIRRVTNARLRVDANAGWSRDQALDLIPRLAEYDLELVEQPLPVKDEEGYLWLKQKLRQQGIKTPIFADESVRTSRDVVKLAAGLDGVVVKLMKTGGLREALRCIHTARAHGLQIMFSCMIESSLGVTAAAHLAPLCDYLDLDGPLLIANDPFLGVRYAGAKLTLPAGPGLGVSEVSSQ